MELYIGGDRRRADRRQGGRREDMVTDDESGHVQQRQGEHRQGDRRQRQRRQALRVVYPPQAAPKVLNTDFRVANISQRGIMFTRRGCPGECSEPIALRSVKELQIQFHDQDVLEVEVMISRRRYDPGSGEETYAGIIEKGLPSERLSKEQAYLVRCFPELCGASST